jgi:glycosyltransferase involved in cell wall biosynthesis
LIISPIFPYPFESGGQVRLYNVIKHLSDNFEVSLLSPIETERVQDVSEIKQFCDHVETIPVKLDRNKLRKLLFLFKGSEFPRNVRRVIQLLRGRPLRMCRFYHPGMYNTLEKMMRKNQYDIVEGVYSQMAPYVLRAKQLDDNITSSLVDIDLSFISEHRQYSGQKGMSRLFSYVEYRRLKNYCAATWSEFDHIVVMSDADKEKLQRLNAGLNIIVSPNGVDISYFRALRNRSPNLNKLAFVGGSNHYPNVDALIYFNDEIYPRLSEYNPDISLTVIGKFVPYLIANRNNHIQFTGFLSDIRSVLNKCAILVVPIRIGGGTRLKILEAMALGVPVVSTSIGCEGIEIENNKHIIISDTPEDFAKSILALLGDRKLYDYLSINSIKLIRQKYCWSKIVEDITARYQRAS